MPESTTDEDLANEDYWGKAASIPEGQNELKRNQLRELAALNGTLRDDENQACQNCTSTFPILTRAYPLPVHLTNTSAYIGGQIGHRKYDCPEQRNFTANIICRVCGNAGHMARDCPDRQRGQNWRNDDRRGAPGFGRPGAAGLGQGDAVDREYEVSGIFWKYFCTRLGSLTNNSNLCKNSPAGPLLLLLVLLVLKAVSKPVQVIPTEVTVGATIMAEADTAARVRAKNRGQMVVLSSLGSAVLPVGLRHGRWAAVAAVVAVVVLAAVVVAAADAVATDLDPTDMHPPPTLPRDRAAYRLGSSLKATDPRQDRLVVRPRHGVLRSTVSRLLRLQPLPRGPPVHPELLPE